MLGKRAQKIKICFLSKVFHFVKICHFHLDSCRLIERKCLLHIHFSHLLFSYHVSCVIKMLVFKAESCFKKTNSNCKFLAFYFQNEKQVSNFLEKLSSVKLNHYLSIAMKNVNFVRFVILTAMGKCKLNLNP